MKEFVDGIPQEKDVVEKIARRHLEERSKTLKEAVNTFLRVGNAFLIAATRLQMSQVEDQLLRLAEIEALARDSADYAISAKKHLESLLH